jgi:hypothetical protein
METVVNLKTAKALGLTTPASMISLAGAASRSPDHAAEHTLPSPGRAAL